MNKREELFKIAREKIVLSDPETILHSLFIETESLKGGLQYKFKLREENTSSAYIHLKNYEWKYKDFGDSDSSGSIIDIVMRVLNISFYDAMLYSLKQLNFIELSDQIENFNTNQTHLEQDELDKRLEELKNRNKLIAGKNSLKSENSIVSRVLNSFPAHTHKKATAYLDKRGIVKIPEEFRVIFGEYEKNDKINKRFGVGVLTENNGADIHFLEPYKNFKTMTFGSSEISYFQRTQTPKTAPILIFESKMDYGAAYQEMNFDNSNIIISNSVSNYNKIVDLIKDKELNGKVFYMNQNDLAGYDFIYKVALGLGVKPEENMNIIYYHLVKEYKQDINDLLLSGINIKSRIKKYPLSKILDAFTFFEENKLKLNSTVN